MGDQRIDWRMYSSCYQRQHSTTTTPHHYLVSNAGPNNDNVSLAPSKLFSFFLISMRLLTNFYYNLDSIIVSKDTNMTPPNHAQGPRHWKHAPYTLGVTDNWEGWRQQTMMAEEGTAPGGPPGKHPHSQSATSHWRCTYHYHPQGMMNQHPPHIHKQLLVGCIVGALYGEEGDD